MQRIDHVTIKLVLTISCLFFGYCSTLKIGETCSTTSANQCATGLKCQTCPQNGNTRPRCTRIQPLPPTSKVKGLPFNRYSWLTTHNSFAITGAKSSNGGNIVAPTNQEDSVTSQLNNGVRGLMLDMYDFENDIWLCHSFDGKCFKDITTFEPAINVLKEIQVFMEANPSEIVTLFIEDYVTSSNGLTNVLKKSGLSKYQFPVVRMPKNGSDWPTVDDMVQKNQRLVVFTSKKSKEVSEGIAYEWNYVVENQYGDGGMTDGSCPSRSESSPMNTLTRSLVLENYFANNPNATLSCEDNSSPLIAMTNTCYKASGKRWPNFIAVDFYQKSDGGGASEAVDIANGHLTCGCDNIAYCKANSTFGTCDVPNISPPPPAGLSPTDAGDGTSPTKDTNSASIINKQATSYLLIGSSLIAMLLLCM